MIRTMTIATMLLLAVPASAKPAPAGMSPLRMDVAGVRLAMPIEQVRTALAAASYSCKPFGNESDFAARVAAEVKDRTGARGPVPYTTGTMQFDCHGLNGEGLTIRFAQVQAGSIVDNFSFRIDGRTVAIVDLRASRTSMRRIVLARAVGAGRHTIEVVHLKRPGGRAGRVDIDGFLYTQP